MSVLPSEADIAEAREHVLFGPMTSHPPPHSITSSARASSDWGMVKPSTFAVLRLMTSSNLVGACIKITFAEMRESGEHRKQVDISGLALM